MSRPIKRILQLQPVHKRTPIYMNSATFIFKSEATQFSLNIEYAPCNTDYAHHITYTTKIDELSCR